jgi:hypothetical protein
MDQKRRMTGVGLTGSANLFNPNPVASGFGGVRDAVSRGNATHYARGEIFGW